MCEFLSFIKKERKLYYLTDAEVFSEVGRGKLSDCKDNDFIGHGAIREFWGISGGKDCEVRDFWETEKLPLELAEMVKEFDKHWGKMLKAGYFMNDDLCYLIEYAPDEWKAKAFEQLLRQKPSNDDLYYLIKYAPDQWKAKASEQLLRQESSNDDLRCIIKYVPGQWEAKAREELNKR